jgi:hypothetical protein
MPTFENNVPPSGRQPSDKADNASATEFRPRRREQWAAAEASQTFDPAPIPPDVKKNIDQRVSEMIRQSRGPDETFFALREWWNTLCRVFFGIPALLRDLFHRNPEEDEEEEDASETTDADAPAERKSGEKSKSRQDDGQKFRQQHRGRRGGRRHNSRGRGGRQQNKPRNDSSDGD